MTALYFLQALAATVGPFVLGWWLTRRYRVRWTTFLRGSLAAGLQLIAPRLVHAAPPPSGRVQLAVIGTGGQGSNHARVWSSLPACRVVAVCDVFKSRMHAAWRQIRSALSEEGIEPP